MELNFDKTCRTCMSVGRTLIPALEDDAKRILGNAFQIWLNENDGLPDKICIECFAEVQRITNFGQKCQNSDRTLREIQQGRGGGGISVRVKQERVDEAYEENSKAEVYCEAFSFGDDGDYYSDSEMEEKFIPNIKLEMGPEPSQAGRYECHYCHLTFKLKKNVKRHFGKCSIYNDGEGVGEELNRQCGTCGLRFSSSRGLKFHREHNKCGDISLLCQICNNIFSTKKALKRHSYLHQNETYNCDVCSAKFRRPDLLLSHKRKNHEPQTEESKASNEGRFVCQYCGFKFKSQKTLDRHCMTLHPSKIECEICQKVFEVPKDLRTHRKVEHKIKDETEKVANLECETCGRMFNSRWKLKEHLLIHANAKPHLCNICGIGFRLKTTLRFHEMRHNGDRPYKCDICTKGYVTQTALNGHLRIHSGEKPYKCKECGRAYTRSDSLSNHMKTHTGERNFPCEYCQKRFLKRDHLKIHVRIHTGEKPFACSICDQRFTQKYDMIKHVRRHQEHQQIRTAEQQISQTVPINLGTVPINLGTNLNV